MCDCATSATAPVCDCDFFTLVDEDRAEFSSSVLPFRTVGELVRTVSDKISAAQGWLVQLSFVERNTDDPVIRIAARNALDEPSADHIRVLLQSVRSTPWYPAIQHVLSELAIAHAHTIFANN